MARKKAVPPKPAGCRLCSGQPWVVAPGGMKRCDCPRGVWFRQRERAQLGQAMGQLRMMFRQREERDMKHYRRSKKGAAMVRARALILAGVIKPADKYIADLPDRCWCKEIVEPGFSLEELLEFSVGYSQRKDDNDDEV